MRRDTLVAIVAGGVLLAAALSGLFVFKIAPTTLRIAVGSPGSDAARVIQSLAHGFAADRHSVRLQPIMTGGAGESAAVLGAAKADLAVVRADLDLPTDARSVAIFRKDTVMIWVPNASDQRTSRSIKSIQDLRRRRVGVVGKTQANVNLLKLILAEAGLSPENVQISQVNANEVADAVRGQKLDALMVVGPIGSRITSEAISATTRHGTVPRFLPINAADIIARKHPVYESSEIAAGALGANPQWPEDDIKTLTVNHLIVARKAVSATTIGAFTKQLFAVRHSLQNEFPDVTKIEVADTDKAAPIPAHAGTAAYIDGTERTFLERYSDFMWLGLMLVSGLASGAAGLRSYLRRDEQLRLTAMRSRLVEMIATVRGIDSIEDLDQMQQEADVILKDALCCLESGAIAEDALPAFGIVLDQFHKAVADRKVWIVNRPESPRRALLPAAVAAMGQSQARPGLQM